MVWPLDKDKEKEKEQESYRSRLFHFRGTHDNATTRHGKSSSGENINVIKVDEGGDGDVADDPTKSKSQAGSPTDHATEKKPSGSILAREKPVSKSKPPVKDEVDPAIIQANDKQHKIDMDQMKERFAKLLLGEDMSGGGKGVSSALALSNAITNTAASVFGEQNRLEPMPPERKARWRKEIDVLLSVTDHIVEFVASQQKNKDGSNMEIMVTRQRNDLHMNVPALKKLDAMLIGCLDDFKDQDDFCYVSKDAPDSEKGSAKRKDDKWWLPTPKVPQDGLTESARKFLQHQKDCVNQVLKAAMAINAQVISEMEIPENYIESLPKNGRASLGDLIYRCITVEFFDPDQFLSNMDLSSEHKILDLKNRIEASIVIWKRKMHQKDSKSGWGSAVSAEKRELFEERAETILLILKHRFPGIPQSALDISKIQYNPDVGQAILESYSRILESLAFTVLSRIEDVLYADYVTQNPSEAICMRNISISPQPHDLSPLHDKLNNDTNTSPSSNAMTLSDFMGWDFDQGNADAKKDYDADDALKEGDKNKSSNGATLRKASYLDNLGEQRSPTSRH